jgi:hypothetical protein
VRLRADKFVPFVQPGRVTEMSAGQSELIISGLLHAILEALIVGQFCGWNDGPHLVIIFGRFSFPVFGMAVRSR